MEREVPERGAVRIGRGEGEHDFARRGAARTVRRLSERDSLPPAREGRVLVRKLFGNFVPDRIADSLANVDLEELVREGVRGVLVDLDNTLLPWNSSDIPDAHRAWLEAARARTFRVRDLQQPHDARGKRAAGARHSLRFFGAQALACRICARLAPDRPSSRSVRRRRRSAPHGRLGRTPRGNARFSRPPRRADGRPAHARKPLFRTPNSPPARTARFVARGGVSVVSAEVRLCPGCGAPLQTTDPHARGYLPPEKWDDPRALCMRCFRMLHYGDPTAIRLSSEDFGEAAASLAKQRSSSSSSSTSWTWKQVLGFPSPAGRTTPSSSWGTRRTSFPARSGGSASRGGSSAGRGSSASTP